MDWADLNQATGNMDSMALACANVYAAAQRGEPLCAADIEQARVAQSCADMLIKDDLYHVLGEGGMDDVQTILFIDGLRRILAFRSAVKAVATSRPGDTPRIPEAKDYDTKTLGITIKARKEEKNEKNHSC